MGYDSFLDSSSILRAPSVRGRLPPGTSLALPGLPPLLGERHAGPPGSASPAVTENRIGSGWNLGAGDGHFRAPRYSGMRRRGSPVLGPLRRRGVAHETARAEVLRGALRDLVPALGWRVTAAAARDVGPVGKRTH